MLGQRWKKWLATRKLPEGKIPHASRRNQKPGKAASPSPAVRLSAREREQEAILKRKRHQLEVETRRLDRAETRLAVRQRRADEAAQWQFEREMEDYVKGHTNPRR
jgi:hypothetical protein